MKSFFLKQITVSLVLLLSILFWSVWVIQTHNPQAIVSWDEGFHGGSALYISRLLQTGFDLNGNSYILEEFLNGIIWYPPLWLFVAGPLGAILGPSVFVYRLATLFLGISSLLLLFYFCKSYLNLLSAFIALVLLGFTPLFIIYSHLMMREMPLLLAVSLALVCFYRYLTVKKNSRLDILLLGIALGVGVLAKIIGIALIYGVIVVFGTSLFLFDRKSPLTKRFFSKVTAYLLLIPIMTFSLYRQFTINFLNADLLDFFLNQSKSISNTGLNPVLNGLVLIFKDPLFYARDLFQMPVFLIIFGVSVLNLIRLFFRSLLCRFVLIWIVVTYFAFSSVKPQASQYVLPIFFPLAISVGILFKSITSRLKNQAIIIILFCLSIGTIGYFGAGYIDKSSSFMWRGLITNQDQAVSQIIQLAKAGERIYISGDGTRFLIRLKENQKQLQTINAAAPICDWAKKDSLDWVYQDFGPHNPVKITELDSHKWQAVATISANPEAITLFKNKISVANLSGTDLYKSRCARWFMLGRNRLTFVLTPVVDKNSIKKNDQLIISLRANALALVAQKKVSFEELTKFDGKEMKITLDFNNSTPNKWMYYTFNTPDYLKSQLLRIETTHIE